MKKRRHHNRSIRKLLANYDISARCEICNTKLLFRDDNSMMAACTSCGIERDTTKDFAGIEQLTDLDAGYPILIRTGTKKELTLEEKEAQELVDRGFTVIDVKQGY